MFKKLLLIILILNFTFIHANKIEDKISLNKKILIKEKKNKKTTSKIIKKLALEISNEESQSDNIEKKLSLISNLIFLNKIKLKRSKSKLIDLEKKSIYLKENTKTIENNIVESIIEKYSVSLSKELINKKSLNDIINKERYDLVLDNAKDKILKSNLNYFKIENDKRKNTQNTKKLEQYIKKQESQKTQYKVLQAKQDNSIEILKSKHERYQNVLKLIITKQSKLNSLLGNLNILKKKKIKKDKINKLKKLFEKEQITKVKEKKKAKEEEKRKKEKRKNIKIVKSNNMKSSSKNIKIIAKQKFEEQIDLKVRNIGSSTKGISISNYKGVKTMAPLKKYSIIKKFGKYFDPVYKIELFNESISLKSKTKNAKVHSILKGKVIYAKSNKGTLGSVVIVKHNNGLHTVYSQLSNIPRSIKVGKWIPKGYVVGRVQDTLLFQATKNSRYINPIKLFK